MILVDTSVWIDHLHRTEPGLVDRLETGLITQHPMVVGELALGSLRDRQLILDLLTSLPQMPNVSHADVLRFVQAERLYGKGLSLVDGYLLASLRLAPATALWSRDKRLCTMAQQVGIPICGE